MVSPLDPKDLVTLEELAISNMWEVAALIEVLEKKGVMKKQEILDAIRELRQKNPKARYREMSSLCRNDLSCNNKVLTGSNSQLAPFPSRA